MRQKNDKTWCFIKEFNKQKKSEIKVNNSIFTVQKREREEVC